MKMLKIVAVITVSLLLNGCGDWGSGAKLGVITKLSKQGWFCPTWEAQIQRGGMNAGTGVVGAPFNVTIEDEKLLPDVQKAMDTQQEVKITYHGERATFCRSDSDDMFLTSIQFVSQSNALETKSQPDLPQTSPADTSAIVKQLLNQQQQLIDMLKK